MAWQRKIPFGYQVQNGRINCHPEEAELVRAIFSRYLLGGSYSQIFETSTCGSRLTAGYPQTKRSSSPVTRPKSNTTRKKSTPIQIGRWSDFMRMRASPVPRLKSERLFSR